VPRQMLASAEYHTTFSVSSALKSFSRSRPVSFVHAMGRHVAGVTRHDKGSHVVVRERISDGMG
jgi:hypothetical protein